MDSWNLHLQDPHMSSQMDYFLFYLVPVVRDILLLAGDYSADSLSNGRDAQESRPTGPQENYFLVGRHRRRT